MTDTQTQARSVLVVEDEVILAMDLCVRLEADGYRIAGMATTGRQALALYEQQNADIVICDINLRGDWNGIQTAHQLTALNPVPIIYLSGLTDKATLEEAKATRPAAYLTKPVTSDCLRVAIEIALSNFSFLSSIPQKNTTDELVPIPINAREGETVLQLGDSVFIKQNYQYVRLKQSDVLYVEAEDKYTTVVTKNRKFVLRLPMAALLQRLDNMALVRVHRSFAVNLHNIESFSDYEVQVPGQTVPLGRVYKEAFLHHFHYR